ncbi:MAG TPA: methyltransferase [Candidatus Tectomicrobia bacterium]|nr:methyltransferase [Candidatus Tectomicrobia bacterium]
MFVETEDGRFALTPLADGLRSKAPVSWRAFAIFCGESWHWRAWGELLHSVHTGQPAFEYAFGTGAFDYFAAHPEAARIFDAAMTSGGSLQNRAVVTAYDFSAGTTVDVGGGEGALLTTILGAYPSARGLLFDLPHVIEAATNLIAKAGLEARCDVVSGSFFEQVPVGGSIYILKRIIHDWDDGRARVILKNCRTAMSDSGRLLLIEHVLVPGNAPSWTKLLDLEMLVITSGGRERTEEEFRALLDSAGFALQRVIPTASPISIIEAVPR